MRRIWPLAWAVLAGLSLLSLMIGAASLSDGDGGWLLMVSRIPRTAAALLAGAGLALAGVVVQQVVQNRLVEPALTGTPEAAMLGLLAVTLIAPGMAVAGKMLIAAGAALAGMVRTCCQSWVGTRSSFSLAFAMSASASRTP